MHPTSNEVRLDVGFFSMPSTLTPIHARPSCPGEMTPSLAHSKINDMFSIYAFQWFYCFREKQDFVFFGTYK